MTVMFESFFSECDRQILETDLIWLILSVHTNW
jgi:hypothetical protein